MNTNLSLRRLKYHCIGNQSKIIVLVKNYLLFKKKRKNSESFVGVKKKLGIERKHCVYFVVINKNFYSEFPSFICIRQFNTII